MLPLSAPEVNSWILEDNSDSINEWFLVLHSIQLGADVAIGNSVHIGNGYFCGININISVSFQPTELVMPTLPKKVKYHIFRSREYNIRH